MDKILFNKKIPKYFRGWERQIFSPTKSIFEWIFSLCLISITKITCKISATPEYQEREILYLVMK